MSEAFCLRGVGKQYPGFRLGPLELSVETGTAAALVGPNGAGKTTLMDLLAGIRTPDSGNIEVLGQPTSDGDPSWKTDVGYASGQQPFFRNWTAESNLDFLAQFYPAWSRSLQAELAQRFELPLGKKVKQLSEGNRTKLSLIAALAHQPRLILLDEPTAGLDPLMRGRLLDTLRQFLDDGESTVVYSTHILSDVSRLADELVFVRDGQLLMREDRDSLENAWKRISFRLSDAVLPSSLALQNHRVQGPLHLAITPDAEVTSEQLHRLGASRIETSRLTLEEIAVHILGAEVASKSRTPSEELEREVTPTS